MIKGKPCTTDIISQCAKKKALLRMYFKNKATLTLPHLTLFLLLGLTLLSCEEAPQDPNSLYRNNLLKIDRKYFTGENQFFINSENQHTYTLKGDCVQEEKSSIYTITHENLKSNSLIMEGDLPCVNKRWQINPMNFSSLEEGSQVKITFSNDYYSSSISLIKDTTPPIITGLSNNETIPVSTQRWNLNCNDPPCSYRYIITNNVDLDTNLEQQHFGIAPPHPTIENGEGLRYLHVQAKDSAGNKSAVITAVTLLDNSPPLVVQITPPQAGTYGLMSNLDFILHYNEPVNINLNINNTRPYINVRIGNNLRQVIFQDVIGNQALLFRYTVTDIENDPDGIELEGFARFGKTLLKDNANNSAASLVELGTFQLNMSEVKVDSEGPIISSIEIPAPNSYRKNDELIFTLNYNEPVQVAGTPGLHLNLAGRQVIANVVSSSNIVGSSHYSPQLRFSYQVKTGDSAMPGEMNFTFTKVITNEKGRIVDSGGNVSSGLFPSSIPDFEGILLDSLSPTVRSIKKVIVSGDDNNYKSNESIDLIVTFNEPVTVAPSTKLSLTVGNTSSLLALYQRGNGEEHIFRYTVSPGENDLDGIIQINHIILNNSNSGIVDMNNNAMAGYNDLNFNIEGVLVDTNSPTFPNPGGVTFPLNKLYGLGERLEFVITYSEPVSVSGGTPYLYLNFTNSYATSLVNSGKAYLLPDDDNNPATHRFSYTIEEGVFDNNGIELPTAITLPDDTSLTDISGNAAQLNIIAPSHLNQVTINSLSNPPKITRVEAIGDGLYRTGESVTLRAHFNRDVELNHIEGLTLTFDSGEQALVIPGGNNGFSSTHDFIYQVGETHHDTSVEVTGINLGNGFIRDRNNNLLLEHNIVVLMENMTIDSHSPRVLSVTKLSENGEDNYYKAGDLIKLQLRFNEEVNIPQQTELLLTVGDDADVIALYYNGEGDEHLFHYRVSDGENDTDGTIFVTKINLKNATNIEDAAGNTLISLNNLGLDFPQTFVDTSAPSRLGNWLLPSNREHSTGEILSFTITYDEPIVLIGEGTPFLNLTFFNTLNTNNITQRSALLDTDSNNDATTTYRFVYLIKNGDFADNGIELPSQISFPEGVTLVDAAGNLAATDIPAPNHLSSVTVDTTHDSPSLLEVTSLGDGLFKAGESVTLVASFNREVQISQIGGLLLSVGTSQVLAPLNGNGSYATTHHFTYTVANDHNEPSVSVVGIKFNNGDNTGSIVDRDNNQALDRTLLIPISNLIVDSTPPRVSVVERLSDVGEDRYYKEGDTVKIKVTFNESVEVNNQTQLVLSVGKDNNIFAGYANGHLTEHTFRYTVTQDQNDSDGVIQVSQIILRGNGQITDLAGNALTSLTNLGKRFNDAIIDTKTPTVSGNWQMPTNKKYGAGEIITFQATFNEEVIFSGNAPYLHLSFENSLNAGQITSGLATLSSLDSDNNPNTQVFNYTVVDGIYDNNGIDLPSSITLNENSGFTDLAGNTVDLNITFPQQHLPNVTINSASTFPEVISFSSNGDGFLNDESHATITATFSKIVKVQNVRGILLRIGNETKWANWNGGENFKKTHLFTLVYNEGTVNNQEVTVVRIGLGNGKIVDQLNNPVLPKELEMTVNNLRVDVVSPEISWESTPSPSAVHNSYTWNWSCNESVDCSYRTFFNQQAVYNLSNQTIFSREKTFTTPNSEFSPGTHYLHVQAKDQAGNLSSVVASQISMDTTTPSVVKVTPPDDGVYGRKRILSFLLEFSEEVIVNSNEEAPFLNLSVGQNSRRAYYTSGSSGRVLTFQYKLKVNDESAQGLSLANNISLNNSTISDRAGNMTSLSLEGIIPSLSGIITQNNLASVTITNAPQHINISNQSHYEFSGECSENHRSVRLSYSILDVETNLTPVICNNESWNSGIINFESLDSEGLLKLIARHDDSGGVGVISKLSVIKDTVEPSIGPGDIQDITEVNEIDYLINGTCTETGDFQITIAETLNLAASCSNGTWTTSQFNAHKLPNGVLPVKGSIIDDAGNSFSFNFQVTKSSKFYLPYRIYEDRSYMKIKTGGKPNNYIGTVFVPGGYRASITEATVSGVEGGPYTPAQKNVMGERWKKLFELEESSGIISVINRPSVLRNQIFNIPRALGNEIYRTSDLYTYFSHNDFPLPSKFSLDIVLISDTEDSINTSIEVHRPQFGNPDCDIVDWDEDLGTTWTQSTVNQTKKDTCINSNFAYRPRGIRFTTTQEDTDNLPNQLSQAKENYRIIFKDEFNNNGGSEAIDERLWTVFRGKECNNIQLKDGSISFEIVGDCTSTGGSVTKLHLAPKLKYRYGYIEAHFSKVFTSNDHNFGRMMFNSYGPMGQFMSKNFNKNTKSFQNQPSFRDFICRGSNRPLKRQRWLESMGVEMQYLEMFTSNSFWVVWHIMEPSSAKLCHDNPFGVHSGVLWNTFSFRKEDTYTIGVEWTPSGYRLFFNGVPYTGTGGGNTFSEYGYSLPRPTNVYIYETTASPASKLFNRTVSHIYQSFNVGGEPGRNNKNWPSGFSIPMAIDYIRVYQPLDNYASETKTYD